MKITVYAQLDRGQMYEIGKSHGLNEDAANFFSYLNEIEIELTVREGTGVVTGATITEQFQWSNRLP